MTLFRLAGLLACLPLASPAIAAVPAPLACIAASHSERAQADIEANFAALAAGRSMIHQADDQLLAIARRSADVCAPEHGWDDVDARFMAMFELGRLMETALRRSGRLSADQLAQINRMIGSEFGKPMAGAWQDEFHSAAMERAFPGDGLVTDADAAAMRAVARRLGFADGSAAQDDAIALLTYRRLQILVAGEN